MENKKENKLKSLSCNNIIFNFDEFLDNVVFREIEIRVFTQCVEGLFTSTSSTVVTQFLNNIFLEFMNSKLY